MTSEQPKMNSKIPISPETLAALGTENYTVNGNVLRLNTSVSFPQFAAFAVEVSKLKAKPHAELEFVDGKTMMKYTFI